MIQRRIFLVGLLVSMCLLLPTNVMAGDENNPEILDLTKDSDDLFQDLFKCWVQGETATDFQLVIKMAGSPNVWQQGDFVQGEPTPPLHYEFYFTINGADYAASAIVSVAKPVSVPFIEYDLIIPEPGELRNVTYVPETNTISEEEFVATITPTYDQVLGAFVLPVSKSLVGNPQAQDTMTNVWAAVWNAEDHPASQRREVDNAIDSANSYTDPGLDFEFQGGLEYSYSLYLSGTTTISLEAGSTVEANITARYDSANPNVTADAELDVFITGEGIVTLSDYNITFNESGSVTIHLNYTAPAMVINTTYANISIMGVLTVEETPGSLSTFEAQPKNITVTIEPKTIVQEEIDPSIFAFFATLLGVVVMSAIILVVIIVVVIAVALSKRKNTTFLPIESQQYPQQPSYQQAEPVYYRPPPPPQA